MSGFYARPEKLTVYSFDAALARDANRVKRGLSWDFSNSLRHFEGSVEEYAFFN
jgi:hypothetical protein